MLHTGTVVSVGNRFTVSMFVCFASLFATLEVKNKIIKYNSTENILLLPLQTGFAVELRRKTVMEM